MWLKIQYLEIESEYVTFEPNKIRVVFDPSIIAPIDDKLNSERISRIFPLNRDCDFKSLNSYYIVFFDFENPNRVLGRIDQKATDELKRKIFFSNGLCSIILISDLENDYTEFLKIGDATPTRYERWTIENELISTIHVPKLNSKDIDWTYYKLMDYESLSLFERVVIDEFAASSKILFEKMYVNDIGEIGVIKSLFHEVNEFIIELIFLADPKEPIPASSFITDLSELRDPLYVQILKQQIIDRIIQINSALSYVTSQSFSGAIPILERRSLIRRDSLLGVGSAIKALNRITKYIEEAFNEIAIEDVIIDKMSSSPPLSGITESPLYDSSDWSIGSLSNINYKRKKLNNSDYETKIKLSYFSGRLGYRESEYSITAALNSLSAGISLEWSLMTITHEMLHSHVNLIINSLFYGDENIVLQSNASKVFERFQKRGKLKDERLIDSVRNIIFIYCCRSMTAGSLTKELEYDNERTDFAIPTIEDDFWKIFKDELRNINEIFVHVLDLKYFYDGKTSTYIPLIWSSWSAVPHINADIRQYILRSLLAIASKIDNNPFERFKLSISRFKEILQLYNERLEFPIISKVLYILDDWELLKKYYFPAFRCSLILVDLADKIFYCSEIRSRLIQDENVSWTKDEFGFEDELSYNAPLGFTDMEIKCPIPFLLDRMMRVLKGEYSLEDIERETAINFLIIKSK